MKFAFAVYFLRLLGNLNSIFFALVALLLMFSAPSRSAEEISVRYGAAQRAISVTDLDTFVTTGEISRSLRWYADRLTAEQQASLREVLRKPFEVETNIVTTFVNSPIGESLLRRLLVMFWGGPSDEALYKALRASLVLAATTEGAFTPMEIIRQYPLSKIRIDLDVGLSAVRDLKEIVIDDKQIFALIREQGATGISAASPDELSASFRSPAEPGELEWDTREVTFTNPSRGSQGQLTADLYLPLGVEGPVPLVIISHGVASNRTTFTYLSEHLASHGFAVGAIDHPDTDAQRFEQYFNGFADPPEPQMFVERPNDVTALLDELEEKAATDPAWQGRLRTEGVGVFGQSLGGYTALATGGARLNYKHAVQSCKDSKAQILPFNLSLLLQCRLLELPEVDGNLRDDRVAAVLAVNPITSALFGPEGMNQLTIPTMIVAGSHDFLAPAVEEQIVPFTSVTAEDRYLMLVKNGTHFSFIPAGKDDVFELPSQLLGPDPELTKPAIQWMGTAFFEAHINGSEAHEQLLTNLLLLSRTGDFEYALTQSLSQEGLDAAVQLSE